MLRRLRQRQATSATAAVTAAGLASSPRTSQGGSPARPCSALPRTARRMARRRELARRVLRSLSRARIPRRPLSRTSAARRDDARHRWRNLLAPWRNSGTD
jgi:hypothetical protein